MLLTHNLHIFTSRKLRATNAQDECGCGYFVFFMNKTMVFASGSGIFQRLLLVQRELRPRTTITKMPYEQKPNKTFPFYLWKKFIRSFVRLEIICSDFSVWRRHANPNTHYPLNALVLWCDMHLRKSVRPYLGRFASGWSGTVRSWQTQLDVTMPCIQSLMTKFSQSFAILLHAVVIGAAGLLSSSYDYLTLINIRQNPGVERIFFSHLQITRNPCSPLPGKAA